MLKRKYGERPDWSRISKKKYAQTYLETDEFKGYITLLHMVQLTEPLFVQYDKKEVCVANEGYSWLQQFPADQHHSVTTMFNEEGNVIQWYIDICLRNGCEDGKPWMDDLYLDIILFPTGEIIIKDTDELEDAYKSGIIHKELYDLAWKEVNRINRMLCTGDFPLVQLASEHKTQLMGLLK